jgi:hypothetical protein
MQQHPKLQRVVVARVRLGTDNRVFTVRLF